MNACHLIPEPTLMLSYLEIKKSMAAGVGIFAPPLTSSK